jgi:hypothetical protein
MYQGKQEKLVLIKEVSSTHALQTVDQANTKLYKQRVLGLQRNRYVKQQENGDLKILIQVECLNPLAWAVADKIDPVIFKVLRPEGLRELEPKFGHVS